MTHLLLVDDDDNFREGLERHLHLHRPDWEITHAGNGVEALRAAQDRFFHALVTDMLMPCKDGLETVMAFKRQYPATKIVAMSGGGRIVGLAPLNQALLLGAHVVLEKPFDGRVLCERLDELLDPEVGSKDNPSPQGNSIRPVTALRTRSSPREPTEPTDSIASSQATRTAIRLS